MKGGVICIEGKMLHLDLDGESRFDWQVNRRDKEERVDGTRAEQNKKKSGFGFLSIRARHLFVT